MIMYGQNSPNTVGNPWRPTMKNCFQDVIRLQKKLIL